MPSSSAENIGHVIEFLRDLAPRRILEVGIGHGKYGVLVREYLEVWYGRYSPSEWQVELIGIEAFAKYHSPLWDYAYDTVITEDVRHIDLSKLGRFECCLLLDVIEHLEHAEGRALLERLLGVCDRLIISTPLQFEEQGAVFDNDYERHRSLWTRDDYRRYHFQYRKGRTCSVAVVSLQPLPPALGQASSRYFQLRQYLLQNLPVPIINFICFAKSLGRRMLNSRRSEL